MGGVVPDIFDIFILFIFDISFTAAVSIKSVSTHLSACISEALKSQVISVSLCVLCNHMHNTETLVYSNLCVKPADLPRYTI